MWLASAHNKKLAAAADAKLLQRAAMQDPAIQQEVPGALENFSST